MVWVEWRLVHIPQSRGGLVAGVICTGGAVGVATVLFDVAVERLAAVAELRSTFHAWRELTSCR